MIRKKGNWKKLKRKLLCLFMALIFIMGSLPLEALAADPVDVVSIAYERTRTTNLSVAETNQLVISGSNFVKPEVWGGQFGEKKLTIDVANSDIPNGKIVISDLTLIEGMNALIKVKDSGVAVNGAGTRIDLQEIATITGVSSDKVYIGGKLDILGIKLDTVNAAGDLLYVAGTSYSMNSASLDPKITGVTSAEINIGSVRPPGSTSNNEVKLVRYFPLVGSVYTQITVKLTNCVSVVQPIVGVDVERVDPNTGAKDKLNTVTLYGKPGFSKFLPSMRVFVSKNGVITEGTTVGLVENSAKETIGLKVTLPKVATSGVADIILKTSDLTGEYIKANGFTYVDADNGLSIDPPPNGITPASKKETEKLTVTITGRNIGYFSAAGYDQVTGVSAPTVLGYDTTTYPNFPDNNFYKVKYTGKYATQDVVIIREISVTISDYAKVDETLPLAQQLQISSSGDIIKVLPVDVAIVEPKKASVTIKTQTTVFLASNPNDIKFARVEEYAVPDGFTFVPDETVPEVKSITPTYSQDPVKGPITDGIYVTLKGVNFQVEIDKITQLPLVPTVELTNGFKTRTLTNVVVYTDNNDPVDGKSNSLGTKIKCRIPNSGTEIFNGAFDVVVTNPSRGKFTLANAFTFKNPDAGAKLPEVYSVVESYADIKGGKVSGETIKITGKNFDTSATDAQRIKVTIDGEYADFTKDKETGKFGVSADGKTVTIIPPPGTTAGFTKLQIINEDGGIASIDFEYKKVTTSPKITKVTPIYGTKGTKIVIKGESFILPDKTGLTAPTDPAFKGSYVMFNGNELNAYNYTATGDLAVDANNSIYCTENGLNGQMVEVIDSSTIVVTVPDNFYKFKANPAATNFFDLLEASALVVGSYAIEVRNPDGAKTKEKFSFNYMKPVSTPTIGSIDPNYASVSGGTVVTIIGSGFLKTDLAVFFGTEVATKVEYVSATELRVMVPAYPYTLAMGVSEVIVPVTVLNYDGGSASYYYIDPTDHTKDKIFKYKVPDSKPSIKTVDPLKGSTSGGDKLKINGKDFRRTAAGVNEPKVYINGVMAVVEWIGDLNSTEWLTVTTPPSTVEGAVDIVLVNYDSGTASFKGFSYVKTKPVIKSFIPNLIALKGNSNGLITGSNFTKWNNMSALVTISGTTKEQVNVPGSTSSVDADTVLDTLIYFGDSVTKDKIVIDTVSGVPYDFMDNLRFDVDRLSDSETRVFMSLASDVTHTPIAGKDMNIGTGKAHLFIITGEQQGKPGVAEEGILVEVTTDQVSIQRRIATQAKLGDQDFYSANSYSSAMVTTPPFSKIGKRTAYLRNGDGAIASIGVEVTNPLSNPQITGIFPRSAYKDRTSGAIKIITTGGVEPAATAVAEWYTYIPLAGGVQMTINGSDFRENVKVYLNEKVMEIVSRSDAKNKLLIKIPAGTAADTNLLKSLIIINEDGGSVNSGKIAVPHFIMYKDATSTPTIKSLSRTKTSQNKYAETESDLNVITLNGYGFISGMRAFVGNVECPKVELDKLTGGMYDDTHARITIPKDLPLGPNLLQIINPDNGFFEMKNAITVISDPKISAVYTEKGALISPVVLSIEGQNIKLTGDGFTEGSQVIIGGTLKPSTYVPTSTEKVTKCTNNKDEDVMVIGGVFASNVKLVAATSTTAAYLTLTTPRQELGATSIIVLASDSGVSNSITGDYQKPYPDKPTGLYAVAVDSDTVKLEWPFVDGIRYYEVYVCKSKAFKNDSANDQYEYKGSITPIDLGNGVLRSFVEGLEPNTYYSFKLKSVNNFGASRFSDASAKYIVNTTTNKPLGFVKTLSTAITDYFQTTTNYKNTYSLEDKLSYQGRMSIMTAGERSMQAKLLTVAYNKPEFVLNDPKVLDINVELLKKYRDVTILIDDYSLSLKMTSQDMITIQAEALSETSAKDAKMRVTLDKRQGTSADQIRIRIPSGYGMVLQPMKIGLDLFQGQTSSPQTEFSNQVAATFKYADAKKSGFPGGVYVAYYNTYTRKLELMGTTEGTGTADSQIIKTGSYIVLGKKTK